MGDAPSQRQGQLQEVTLDTVLVGLRIDEEKRITHSLGVIRPREFTQQEIGERPIG